MSSLIKTIEYDELNKVINKVFFDGRFRDLPVYLDLEDSIETELASCLSCSEEQLGGLIGRSVAKTLSPTAINIYSHHTYQLNEWRADKKSYLEPPPFTALLLALSLAAERMSGGDDISQNNYYQRLCEVFGLPASCNELLGDSRKNTKIFWLHLNLWLIDNNYDYGKPTAAKVTHWTYVSFAISQSLIRDAERESFKKLFKRFKLSSHDAIGEGEMLLFLHEWMASNDPSTWLKKIWSNSDLRERVIQSALHELENWDDVTASGDESSSKNLFWTLAINKLPRRKLVLCLATTGSSDIQDIPLKVKDNSQVTTAEAFDECVRTWLNRLPGTDFFYIEPINQISIEALILSTFELATEDDGLTYSYSARPIITLMKLDTSRYYKQVPYVSLFFEHMILCHDKWHEDVVGLLTEIAREGFREYSSEAFPGVPKGWVLIDGVQLLRKPADEVENNLKCLVPLSEGVVVSIQEGLKLATGIWHSKAPPQVYAADDDGILNIELRASALTGKDKSIYKQETAVVDPDFLSKLDIEIDTKNFMLVAMKGNKSVSTRAISFRSATSPRSIRRGEDLLIVHVIDADNADKNLPFPAELTEVDENDIYIQGMTLIGDVGVSALSNFDLMGDGNIPVHEEVEFWSGYLQRNIEGQDESCIIRGYHYWILEPFEGPGAPPNSGKMECKDCGMVTYERKRKRKRKTNKGDSVVILSGTPTSAAREVECSEGKIVGRKEVDISPDTVFDAVCYLGTGMLRKLDSIISSIDMQPWQVSEVRRNLVDLGHIDIVTDRSSEYFNKWTCCQPMVTFANKHSAFLSGFRNESMLNVLYENASILDVEIKRIEQDRAPCAYLINCEEENTGDLLDGILDPYGREVLVNKSPAMEIISVTPSMKNYKYFMSSISIADSGDIEKFNPQTGKWQKGGLSGVGAYRTFLQGRCYFFHDEESESFQGDFSLVKILAARHASLRLHRFNSDSDEFECMIGCEPPGFIKRALVSCSGLLPKKRDSLLVYQGVPADIARYALYKMYT